MGGAIKIAFRASETEIAQDALRRLTDLYGQTDVSEADVIVALGGDGFMLETLLGTMAQGGPCLWDELRHDRFSDERV